jgi:hypothetical protein
MNGRPASKFTYRTQVVMPSYSIVSALSGATCSGLGPSLAPHAEHTWDVGTNRVSPRSMPITGPVSGSAPGPVSGSAPGPV